MYQAIHNTLLKYLHDFFIRYLIYFHQRWLNSFLTHLCLQYSSNLLNCHLLNSFVCKFRYLYILLFSRIYSFSKELSLVINSEVWRNSFWYSDSLLFERLGFLKLIKPLILVFSSPNFLTITSSNIALRFTIHLDFWSTMLSYESTQWTNLVNPKGVLCECLTATLALSHGPVSAEVSIMSCSESSSDIFELLCFVLDICKRPLLQIKSKVFSNGWLLKMELENLQLNS